MKIVANPVSRALFLLLILLGRARPGGAAEVPVWLPHYDLDIQLQVEQHRAVVHERVTWTNRHKRPAQTIVFNNHSHFRITSDIGLLAKMLEILRLAPSDALDFDPEAACQVQKVSLVTLGALPLTPDPSPPSTGERGERGQPVTKAGPYLSPLPLYSGGEGSGVRGAGASEDSSPGHMTVQPLTFGYQAQNDTALEIALPHPVAEGETVILDLEFNLRLPQKQGRWGQWEGVTFLAQWLPVLAVYDDDHGWQPTPFVPWHQPFFNDAGIYSARIVLPADQKLGCSGTILRTTDLPGGLKEVIVAAAGVRDFALFCSARFQEFTGVAHVGGLADAHLAGSAGGPQVAMQDVPVRVLAFPEHAFYAEQMVRVACEAIPVYSRWFGPYAYPQFTVVESYFGWNGNECGGLVMIDVRIFDMPHIAAVFVDSLLSHEICHQWWYNAVGTNGYRETWMDEGLATYFSHRLMDLKVGKNNMLLDYPSGLKWLPNIKREDYKNYSYLGVCGRGEQTATVVEDMTKFSHLVNLSAMAYDRGSKVLGMIETRMGEAAFFDFMRHVFAKYRYGILLVADFRRELEEYTGQNWGPFFHDWIYGAGMTDWAVDRVRLHPIGNGGARLPAVNNFLAALHHGDDKRPFQATIWLRQCGQICESTVVGICLDGSDCYQIRVPIQPGVPFLDLPDLGARVEWVEKNLVRVDIVLPCRPTQIAVDPDQILVDSNPANNAWKPRCRFRVTPLYTQLEETDLTNSYDRWNFILGPWVYGAAYADPWFSRSPMLGIRAGAYRTQELSTGAYLAYRTDDRNIVAGVDGVLDHWPIPHTQVGFIFERSLTTWDNSDQAASRGVVYGRYILTYGDSLYLAPFKYVEVFSAVQSHPLPDPVEPTPGANLFHEQSTMGVHYHMNYLTPYWNPEGGLAIDATYDNGIPVFGEHQPFYRTFGQISYVKCMPSIFECLYQVPGLSWIPDTRWAARLYGGIALPDNAEVFTLGGGNLFRGFDLNQRQGNAVWVGSLEWRIPLARGLTYDFCDHVGGLRSIWGSAFYDVGNAYLNNHQQGPIAHAVGGGVYMDITWFGLIERTLIGVDVAKTVNESTPWQAWFRVNFPF